MAKIITIPFKPHNYQEQICAALRRFNVLVCHRRFGKTVVSVNLLIRGALESKKTRWRGAYLAPLYRQAKAVAWDYIRFYTAVVPGVEYNQAELRVDFPNGARIQLLGADNPDTLRGIYLDAVVLDEYAYMAPRAWTEIIRPALADRKGWALFIGTPSGHNHFYDLYQYATDPAEKTWYAGMYRSDQTDVLDPEEVEAARREMADEEFNQEFLCSFSAAVRGAYYGNLIETAENEGRLCAVPIEPTIDVHTAWDLGISDSMSIWFFQALSSGEIRIVDYHEDEGKGLDHYAHVLRDKGYLYGTHIAPHDIAVRELGTGRSRFEVAESLGIRFVTAPKLPVAEGINAARTIIPRCWFNKGRCGRGVEALRQYRRDFNNRLGVLGDRPLHDWTSHAADAFRALATGMHLLDTGTTDQDAMAFIQARRAQVRQMAARR